MNQKFSIDINPDEEGFTGRECPKCKKYFKIKFETGLPIQCHICPYCGFKGSIDEFLTEDQDKYAEIDNAD